MPTLSHIKWLAFITVLVNAAAMLSPIINGGDSITYAALAQHIASSNDWSSLILDGQDWLDKPHLPFWMTAVFFKLFGVSTFTYILPGFLAHLVGGFFTYRIARLFYGRDAAWLSVLVYVSAYHLMDSSIEVKAETYLTAFIMGACYYWLRFDAQVRIKYLLLGAAFSALAVMTKGVFTLITISSGLVCMWIFQQHWQKLWSLKWWGALLLALVFTVPELYALYVQFDAHPEKLVFEHTHVSGIKFFLWDSQFGRFFNSGPIQNHNGHPFYFVLVWLWSFLPWVLVFFAALLAGVRNFSTSSHSEKSSLIFLCGGFFITFALFSATSFQLDHYTVILCPFAAILCGKFLHDWLQSSAPLAILSGAQRLLAVMLAGIAITLTVLIAKPILLAFTAVACVLIAAYVYRTYRDKKLTALAYPVLAINLLFGVLALFTALTFQKYDVPYHAARVLSEPTALPKLYAHQMALQCRELAVYLQRDCQPVDDFQQLGVTDFVILLREQDSQALLLLYPNATRLATWEGVIHKTGTFNKLLAMARDTWPLERVALLHVHRP
jgi:4-amino-4-deoxy-L-arabinose transferase-like glycosyltransferase